MYNLTYKAFFFVIAAPKECESLVASPVKDKSDSNSAYESISEQPGQPSTCMPSSGY